LRFVHFIKTHVVFVQYHFNVPNSLLRYNNEEKDVILVTFIYSFPFAGENSKCIVF